LIAWPARKRSCRHIDGFLPEHASLGDQPSGKQNADLANAFRIGTRDVPCDQPGRSRRSATWRIRSAIPVGLALVERQQTMTRGITLRRRLTEGADGRSERLCSKCVEASKADARLPSDPRVTFRHVLADAAHGLWRFQRTSGGRLASRRGDSRRDRKPKIDARRTH
jgi:hypothetical protein